MGQTHRMTRGRFQILLWQRIGTILILLAQLGVLIYTIQSNSKRSILLQVILTAVSVFAALHVMARKDKGAYKLSLIFLILLFPIFGGVFYWLYNLQLTAKGLQKRLNEIEKNGKYAFLLLEDSYEVASREASDHMAEIRYLQKFNGFPVYKHTQTSYYASGEEAFEEMLREMEKAKQYIFGLLFIAS
ncbi:MAG: cardiolipin synthetase [Evtepia sp.]|nr:cardiolipin synthetase [Evtepia sp.]